MGPLFLGRRLVFGPCSLWGRWAVRVESPVRFVPVGPYTPPTGLPKVGLYPLDVRAPVPDTGVVGRVVGFLIAVMLATSSVARGGASPPRFNDVGPNVRLSIDQLANADEPGGESQREPHIAIDPTDPRHLLVGAIEGRRNSDGYPLALGYYVSHDGGRTWEVGLVPGASALTGSDEYDFASDPVVAFGPDGTQFFTYQSFDAGEASAIQVSHTDAEGEWESPTAVATDPDFQRLDKPWIAVDLTAGSPFFGRVYVAWVGAVGPFSADITMYLSSSSDGGHVWSTPVAITPDRRTQGAQVLVEEGGAVTVVYFDLTDDRIRAVRSEDGGSTWAAPATVAEVERAPIPGQRTGEFYPSATIDPSTQTMHVVWQDARRDVADIMHSRSKDAGATWSDPQRVNGGPKGIESFDGAVDAAGGGVHVIFYDGRDGKDRDDLYNLYYAQSTNDGRTFLRPNLKVTSRSFDIDYAAPNSGGLFLGDYIGIAALRKRAHAVWIDTREPSSVTDAEGQNDIFSARITP